MSGISEELEVIAEDLRLALTLKDTAREKALPLVREIIRYASQSIRAVHRREFERAEELLQAGRKVLDGAEKIVNDAFLGPGYLRDAQKEYAEGRITLAVLTRQRIPHPEDLHVEAAAYLNGLGEAVGELRRYLLDSLRRGDLSRGEELLGVMDDIYNVLVTMDFPDAITGGLRHTTDTMRGVLEKTRSDLTLTMRQNELEEKLAKRSQG